jgi:zinc protease
MYIRLFLPLLLALLTTPATAAPNIQHWTMANGARVYFVPIRELPMVDIKLVFDGGSARDQSLPGLARFTNSMLQEGAGRYDADAIAERLAALGAELSTDSARDMASVRLRVLSDPVVRDPAVELLGLIVGKPTFAPSAIRRVRGQLLVELQEEQQSPAELATRAFYSNAFNDHPYSLPPSGTEASLAAIGTADLRRFHQHYYVSRNVVVAIVGDLDRAQAELLVANVVAELPNGEPASQLPGVPRVEASASRLIAFPSVQTHILMGRPAISRLDDDYYALYVGNHILGGGDLVSLLFEEIRERRGLAYSVGSYITPMRAEGPYIMSLQTRTEKTREAVDLMRTLLTRFVNEGPTAEQLAAAKKNITGGFPLRVDSNRNILNYVAMIGFYGLPVDYLDTFNERIDAITVDDVRTAFARHIDPQRLVTVMVGPGEALEARVPESKGPSISQSDGLSMRKDTIEP